MLIAKMSVSLVVPSIWAAAECHSIAELFNDERESQSDVDFW
jgi:hypothetical protein